MEKTWTMTSKLGGYQGFKERILDDDYIGETISITRYTHYGNLIKVP